MRTCSRSLPLSATLSALALGCADAPPSALAGLPGGFDVALRVVAADALSRGAAAGPTGARRPSLAVGAAVPTVSPPIDLGTLGGDVSFATAVNNAGQVVGPAETASGEVHAFLWTEAGGMRDLGSIEGSGFSYARGINAAGHVVGVSTNASGAGRAFVWTPEGGMQNLGVLGGTYSGSYSDAFGINAAGQVVGTTTISPAGEQHAFLWTPERGMQNLATLGITGSYSEALGINDAGQVIGASIPGGAFLWTSEAGVRGFSNLGGCCSGVRGINAAGHVVGTSYTASGERHAVRWTPDGGIQDLGTLGGDASEGVGINAAGYVAGNVYSAPDAGTGSPVPRAFFWQPGTGAVLLPPLSGDVASEASALNDRGQVVGASWACAPEEGCGRARAVLWSVGAGADGAPLVDRLHAVVLPPGIIPNLSGVWLRVRLRDPGDAGPWDWRIDWGDGVITTPTVTIKGEFAFLRSTPYTTTGPHTVTVTATDSAGLTSAATTTTAP